MQHVSTFFSLFSSSLFCRFSNFYYFFLSGKRHTKKIHFICETEKKERNFLFLRNFHSFVFEILFCIFFFILGVFLRWPSFEKFAYIHTHIRLVGYVNESIQCRENSSTEGANNDVGSQPKAIEELCCLMNSELWNNFLPNFQIHLFCNFTLKMKF